MLIFVNNYKNRRTVRKLKSTLNLKIYLGTAHFISFKGREEVNSCLCLLPIPKLVIFFELFWKVELRMLIFVNNQNNSVFWRLA